MQLGFDVEIKQEEDGGISLICDSLGYATIASSFQQALEHVQNMVNVDPALADVPSEKRSVKINLERREIEFAFHPEILPALLAKVRKRRSIEYKQLAERMGMEGGSTGAISKYFNAKTPTMPRVDTLLRLATALKFNLTLS